MTIDSARRWRRGWTAPMIGHEIGGYRLCMGFVAWKLPRAFHRRLSQSARAPLLHYDRSSRAHGGGLPAMTDQGPRCLQLLASGRSTVTRHPPAVILESSNSTEHLAETRATGIFAPGTAHALSSSSSRLESVVFSCHASRPLLALSGRHVVAITSKKAERLGWSTSAVPPRARGPQRFPKARLVPD